MRNIAVTSHLTKSRKALEAVRFPLRLLILLVLVTLATSTNILSPTSYAYGDGDCSYVCDQEFTRCALPCSEYDGPCRENCKNKYTTCLGKCNAAIEESAQ
jgi:hypothetical protein